MAASLEKMLVHHAELRGQRPVAGDRQADPDDPRLAREHLVHQPRHAAAVLGHPLRRAVLLAAAGPEQRLAVVAAEAHDDDVRLELGDLARQVGEPVEDARLGQPGRDAVVEPGADELDVRPAAALVLDDLAGAADQRVAGDVEPHRPGRGEDRLLRRRLGGALRRRRRPASRRWVKTIFVVDVVVARAAEPGLEQLARLVDLEARRSRPTARRSARARRRGAAPGSARPRSCACPWR